MLTNYQQWQANKYGDILPEPILLPSGEMESGAEELQRETEWVERQAELQLMEQWDTKNTIE